MREERNENEVDCYLTLINTEWTLHNLGYPKREHKDFVNVVEFEIKNLYAFSIIVVLDMSDNNRLVVLYYVFCHKFPNLCHFLIKRNTFCGISFISLRVIRVNQVKRKIQN